ncbi:MAG TPA: Ig-like domain-containing protein, partial [Verrucomicrobiae bacterium]|nr:Ig-like domain-containing protein [Verrucomicrobiae bacterium]
GQQGDLTLSGVVWKNFFFTKLAASETPPTLSISTIPVRPAPGQTAQVLVTASLPTGAPTVKVALLSVGTTNLLTGQIETNVMHTFTDLGTVSGGNVTRWQGTLTVNEPVLTLLKVVVDGPSGAQDATMKYPIAFTGPLPIIPGPIPPPDTNDVRGPLVMETRPVDNSFLGEDGSITIAFNKSIDTSVTNNLEGIILDGPGEIPLPVVRLRSNQRELVLQYPGLAPDGSYRLTLSGESIRDLAGQALDQRPSTPDEFESFSMTLRTPPANTAELPGLADGRGTVISGNRLYALDHAPQNSHLNVYDIKVPLQPELLSRTRLFGQPRDLAVVPQFKFKRTIHSQQVETNDLVAVVGGDLDALINTNQGTTVSVRGQYLSVVKVDADGATEVLASPIVSYRVSSAATKVRWVPPYLAYQEYGQDIQLIGLVNLQEMIIGFQSTATQRLGFRTPGSPNADNVGKDLDGNGDYVGEGESLPLPDVAPTEFYGKKLNYVLEQTTQKIQDFAFSPGGLSLGITLREGRTLDLQGNPLVPLPAMYRTLQYSGLPLDISDPTSGVYPFEAGAYPRWVSVFDTLEVEFNGSPFVISAALVSLQPDEDGVQKLAVIDISQPLDPKLLNKIPIPDELLGGFLGSVRLNQGLLEVAGSKNVVLLDPAGLVVTNFPAGQMHPAIVGSVSGAGAGTRNLALTDFGVRAVADGGRGQVVQSPPKLSFVRFPSRTELLVPSELREQSGEQLGELFQEMEPTRAVAPARVRNEPTVFVNSDLEPVPNSALHYYVLVNAPGGAGAQIELGLESLNPAGRPLSNPGVGFAPVRAVSDRTQEATGQKPLEGCGATIRALPAWRLSDNPNSPFYNKYLSRPFALVTETVSADDLFRLTFQFDREIIFSGAALRAFIEPGQEIHPDAGPVIGSFAARIDVRSKQIFPIGAALAISVNRDYIVGDNPPPSGGATPFEDTYGAIMSHSGELRTT